MNKQRAQQKPLELINKSKYLNQGYEMLDELIKIHISIKHQVDFNIKDNQLAVYLILGGMISCASRSLYALQYGNSESHAQLQRLLAEAMDLANFFCETSGNSRQVKQWFNGRIISREPGNKGNLTVNQRAKLLNTEELAIRNMDDTVKTANDVLSPYMHPSYTLVTATFDNEINSFRYYAQRQVIFTEDEISGKSRLIIHSVLTAFGIALVTLFPLSNTRSLERIGSFTEELYPEAFVTS